VPLLTLEQCRTQCRVCDEDSDADLASLLSSAEDACAAYLNRRLFESAAELDSALDALPSRASEAKSAYDAAIAEAKTIEDDAGRCMAIKVAIQRRDDFDIEAQRTLSGLVANGSVLAAVRLTLGHFWANPEGVVVGVTATELPLGVKDLLRPYRRMMGP
jgi:hypothetical protein